MTNYIKVYLVIKSRLLSKYHLNCTNNQEYVFTHYSSSDYIKFINHSTIHLSHHHFHHFTNSFLIIIYY